MHLFCRPEESLTHLKCYSEDPYQLLKLDFNILYLIVWFNFSTWTSLIFHDVNMSDLAFGNNLLHAINQ